MSTPVAPPSPTARDPQSPSHSPQPQPQPQALPPSLAGFLQSGLSITVAACGERRVPSIAKAVGCQVSEDGRTVTVLIFEAPARDVLRDLARDGRIAVCFSRPSTHQTVQLKASRLHIQPATGDQRKVARRCLDLLDDDLVPLGYPRPMLDRFFWHESDTLLALVFEPEGAFAQTPGPGAGAALQP